MNRPAVSLEGARKLYEFYDGRRQNPIFAKYIAHPLLGKIYKPNISVDEGAEDKVERAIEAGRRLIVSPNHLTGDDQYIVASVVQAVKVLRPLIGNTFIPTEPSLSSRSGLKGRALRWIVDEMGSIPIMRMKDINKSGIGITSEAEELHRKAMLMADEVEFRRLVVGGQHMAPFHEGQRNRTDHRKVQPLKKGVAHTALRAAQEVGISLLPLGFYYGGEPSDYTKLDVPKKREPTVHIGSPIEVDPEWSPNDLIDTLRPAIQHCVDMAVEATIAA